MPAPGSERRPVTAARPGLLSEIILPPPGSDEIAAACSDEIAAGAETRLPPPAATRLPPPAATRFPPPAATRFPPPAATSGAPPFEIRLPPPAATRFAAAPVSVKLPPPAATRLPPPLQRDLSRSRRWHCHRLLRPVARHRRRRGFHRLRRQDYRHQPQRDFRDCCNELTQRHRLRVGDLAGVVLSGDHVLLNGLRRGAQAGAAV